VRVRHRLHCHGYHPKQLSRRSPPLRSGDMMPVAFTRPFGLAAINRSPPQHSAVLVVFLCGLERAGRSLTWRRCSLPGLMILLAFTAFHDVCPVVVFSLLNSPPVVMG
jgi:hypothetical protein